MGGATVLATELRRPGTIRAAWGFEPIVFPRTDAITGRENPMAATARRRRHDFSSFDEVIERYTGRFPFTNVDPAALRDYVMHGFRKTVDGVTLKTTGENEARTFEGIDVHVFARLGELTIPTTVIGSGDGQNPATVASLVAEAIPNGQLEPWSERSHFGPFEDPTRAAASILDAVG